MIEQTLTRRRLLSGGGSLALLAMAAACGGGRKSVSNADSGPSTGSDLVAAAQKEGSLTLYCGTNLDATRGWATQFTNKYGIKVDYYRDGSYPVFQRWQTETKVGKNIADLVLVSDQTLLDRASKAGQLRKYTPPEGSKYPKQFTLPGQYYPLNKVALGIAWNSKTVSAADAKFIQDNGFDALADARWKGKSAVSNITSGGTDYTWWYLLMHHLGSRYGTAFVRRIADQKPTIFDSSIPLFDQLVAGEYAITGAATESTAGLLYGKGAPVRWSFPDPTPTIANVQGISATAPHPEAAKLFQQWATSVEGQEAWYNGNWTAASLMNPDAKDTRKFVNEPWYSPPKNEYTAWTSDPDFTKVQSDLFNQWAAIFKK